MTNNSIAKNRAKRNDQSCEICGYPSLEPITRNGKVICYSCMLKLDNRSGVENHHILGKSYPDTISLYANLHRDITALQRQWPDEIRNPDNPLLIIAAVLRSIADFAVWLAVHCARFSDWLIALWRILTEQFPQFVFLLPLLWR